MNKYIAGIFFASAMVGALSSCTAPDTGSKIVINEVLVDNQDNFQDDYGVHSGWVEIFNTSYNSVNLAGCYLKVSSESGAPIPAGLQFGISNSLPVSFMGEISIENALTTDEKREVLGYGPAEIEQQPAQNPADNGTDTSI